MEALRRNVKNYHNLYSNIEIIVVNDGCPPFDLEGAHVINLPEKEYPLNPCVPLNIGIGAASCDRIVLTNPEIEHKTPILDRMVERHTCDDDYVIAACWNGYKWYCHSTATAKTGIVNGGYHFCTLMHRGLYARSGGFDEDYRYGQGYEDKDFLWRLRAAGARFVMCDDLVVYHTKAPRVKWPESNKKLFERKWKTRL